MQKIKSYIPRICETLEFILGILVMIGIVLGIFNLVFRTGLLPDLASGKVMFSDYLERIFNLVIGIEFLEMLCRPNSANVLEVLIFLVARHMIVGEISMVQDFLSVISICLLCVVRRYLRINLIKIGEEPDPHEGAAAEQKQSLLGKFMGK